MMSVNPQVKTWLIHFTPAVHANPPTSALSNLFWLLVSSRASTTSGESVGSIAAPAGCSNLLGSRTIFTTSRSSWVVLPMALATHHGIAVGSMHPNGDSHAAEYAFYRGPRIGNS